MLSTRNRVYRNKKFERPFSPHHAIHITLKSDVAKGVVSLYAKVIRLWLVGYLPRLAERFELRLFHYAIVSNHLHLVILAKNKTHLSNFLRALSGNVARKALGAEKGRAKKIKFWTARPYSRVLSWGRELNNVIRYVERNVLEAHRMIRYIPRDLKPSVKVKAFIEQRIRVGRDDRTGQLSLQL